MLRLLLFLTLTTAACAQLLERPRDSLFSPPSQQQQLVYLCSLPENANSAACLSAQGTQDSFGTQSILPQQGMTQQGMTQQGMTLDRGTGYDLSYPQTYPQTQIPGLQPTTTGRNPMAEPARPYRVKEPPTEFQRYVTESIGQSLPIFGASLFDNVPATFLPSSRALVGPD